MSSRNLKLVVGATSPSRSLTSGQKRVIAWFRHSSSISSFILELAYDSDGSALGGRTHMVAIAFSTMVILALVIIVVHWTMRIRLMRLDSTRDRIEWLSFRGGDDVLSTYESLFPRSMLPRFCRFVFWTAIVVAAVGLCAIVVLRILGR